MTTTDVLSYMAWGLLISAASFEIMQYSRDRHNFEFLFNRTIHDFWASIKDLPVWDLPYTLLEMFLDAAERWSGAATRLFESLWFAAAICGAVVLVEGMGSSPDYQQDLRFYFTVFTLGTFFLLRIDSLLKGLHGLGERGHWLWWPILVILALGSVGASVTHTANFVRLYNAELAAWQALTYALVLMFLYRLTFMRLIGWPALTVLAYDPNRKNRDANQAEYLDFLKEYAGIFYDEQPSLRQLRKEARQGVEFQNQLRKNKIARRIQELKFLFGSIQLGFLLSAALTLLGIFIGGYFETESELRLTPQILIVNTICDALTIGATFSLLNWVYRVRESNLPSAWTFRLIFAGGVDLAVAALLAIVSIYVSLVGTPFALSVGQSIDLLIPTINENRVTGLGPEFWIMHTTFIPTGMYMLVLIFGSIAYVLFKFLPTQLFEGPQNTLHVAAILLGVYGLALQGLALIVPAYVIFEI